MAKYTLGRCCELVSGSGYYGSFFPHQCHFKGIVKRNNKVYCKIHDPVYIEQKRIAERKKWDREFAEKNKKEILRNAAPELLEACKLLVSKYGESEKISIQLGGKIGIYLDLKELEQLEQAIAKAEGK